MSKVDIAPSILSADFGHLAEQIGLVEAGGAGLIHFDVMDGHFVPNLTIGPSVGRAVRAATSLPIDVHLMIEEPDRYLEAFRDAGADWISVHVEATIHLQRCVARIHDLGALAGVVLNPASPLTSLEEILDEVDYVLLMSVNPGFGGQAFLPSSLRKVERLAEMIEARNLAVRIEIDGGIGESNARAAASAGATVLVAGSAIFGADDPKQATRRLRAVANGD